MNSSETSSIPSKTTKKALFHSQKPNSNQLSSKTPEKLAQLPLRGRSRNHAVALSISEVRKVAESLHERSPGHSGRPKSARRQIESWPEESPARKPKKPAGEPVKLPEKYEILGEFFDSLDSSIRLLRLKGSTPTFKNICPKIECLTDRRFSYSHLAQLKFILREAIEIKRILVFDERSSCMKPDLHVSINIDAIENDGKLKSESGNMDLRKVFRARLVDFLKSHPKVDEIPEETLPEPFSRPKLDVCSDMSKIPTSLFPVKTSTGALTAQQSGESETCIRGDEIPEGIEQDLNSNISEAPGLSLPRATSTEAPKNQQPAVASHLAPSFRKHFSQKVRSNEAESASQSLSKTSLQPSDLLVQELLINKSSSKEETSSAAAPFPANLSFEPTSNGKHVAFCASPACFPPSCSPATPSKELDAMNSENGSPTEIAKINSTPAKLAFSPGRLMNVTPALHPPKRCYMSPEDDSTSSPNKLVRRPSRSRSLKFDTPIKNDNIVDEKFDTPIKNDNIVDEIDGAVGVSVDDDIFDILPENLLQSLREKERKAIEERDPAISRAKRRRQMIASLPKLFNKIHFLFQSIKPSFITQEELIHKIIASQYDIVDRREVVEQLNLLLELVPDWISEKLPSGGGSLFRINKASSPESIRARLEEAK